MAALHSVRSTETMQMQVIAAPQDDTITTSDTYQERTRNEQTSGTNTVTTPSSKEVSSTSDKVTKYTVLAAASLTLFIGVGYTNTYGVFEEHYQTQLFPNDPPSKLILIGSVASSLYLIMGVVLGRFADLMGYRTSMLVGSGLMVGAMFVAAACVSTTTDTASSSSSSSYPALFLSQGLMFGLGLAFVYLPAVTISRQYWSARRHGLTNGIVVSGGALGGMILPYICRVLIEKRGLPETFRVLGYLAAAVLGPCSFLLKPKVNAVPIWKRSRSVTSGGRTVADKPRPPLMDLQLLKDDRFIGLLVSGTLAMIGFLPRYFLIPPSAIAHGISATYASWLLGLMNGLSIVGRVGIGWLADRKGKVNALSASFILCGLGHFVFWLPGVTIPGDETSTTTAMFTLFSVYTGIFGSGFVSLFPVVVAHLFGADGLASKVGLLNTVVGIGTLAGPSAVYAIIGEGASQHWTVGVLSAGLFMFVGGLLMIGSLTLFNNKRTLRQD